MADSVDAGHDASDEYHDPYCDLCFIRRGHNCKAYGYCKKCYQFLCSECNGFHGSLQATKNHAVLLGKDMPQSQSANPPRFEGCEIHPKQYMDQFCFKDQILLCSVCSYSSHKSCTVMSVEDACKYVQTADIDSLDDTIKDIKQDYEALKSTVDTNFDRLKNEIENILKEANTLYQKIISKANKLIQKLNTELNQKYQSCLSDLSKQHVQINDIVSRLDRALNDIAREKNRTIDTKLFLRLQNVLRGKELWKNNIQEVQNNFRTVTLSMTSSKELQNFLSSTEEMTSISVTDSLSEVKLSFPDISFPATPSNPSTTKSVPSQLQPKRKLGTSVIKVHDDKYECWISGIAVTKDGRKLIVDRGDKKLKLFSKDMKPLFSVKLINSPWDATVISDQDAVVSTDDNKIVRIQILDDKIIIKESIPLAFEPHGIVKYRDALVVTAPREKPASVKLIDLAGKVHWSASTDKQGLRMFCCPWYVSSFDDQRISSVIVTDLNNDTLTLLNGDTGETITRRQLEGVEPMGVTTDTNGNIYVCYARSKQVAILSGDLSQERILSSGVSVFSLLSSGSCLRSDPQAIAYDNRANQLILAYRKDKKVDMILCTTFLKSYVKWNQFSSTSC